MVKMTLDTRNFDKAMDEYMKYSKRSIGDVINAKCWFIARNSTNTTKAVDKSQVAVELEAPSKVNPEVPLVAILTNMHLKASGGKGVNGPAMKAAMEKFKKRRMRSVNFLRAGWLPAVRILEAALKRGDINFSRRFAPKVNRTVKKYGKDKGSAIWARTGNERVFAEIENDVQGGKTTSPRVHSILLKGLQKAINQEIASMRVYIEKKLNPATDKLNR